ncbi:signal recognition particle-docking protein FtsY [Periweissella fabalis]
MGLFDIFRKKDTEKHPEQVDETIQKTTPDVNNAPVNSEPAQEDAILNKEPVVKVTKGIKIPIADTPVTETTPEVESDTTVTETTPEVESDTTVTETTPEVESDTTVTETTPEVESDTTVTETTPEVESDTTVTETTLEVESDMPVTEQITTSEEQAYDKGLEKSRKSFGERLNAFFAKFRSVDEDFFEDLEDTLIQADVGYQTAMQISDELRDEVKLKNAKNKETIRQVIVDKLIEIYEASGNGEDISMHFASEGPTIILFVGVNGVGKTTTIGKMANLYKSEGKKVLLAAADTFRAGATQQLQEWGRRDGVDVVSGPDRVDPASVVFDAVKKAKAESYDVLFVDTAGRLQNNVNLMQELAKMKRIISREVPTAPHEVLIVLDGTTGQNALQQAKLFKESTDVTGIVLTKLDGTAKGGIILAIRNEMHLPVKWVGLGEKATDLRTFSPDQFVQGLFKGLID